jgi:hypothetical protein
VEFDLVIDDPASQAAGYETYIAIGEDASVTVNGTRASEDRTPAGREERRPPELEIQVEPEIGYVPQELCLNAGARRPPAGELGSADETYVQWDIFSTPVSVQSATGGQARVTLDQVGTYHVHVRGYDEAGVVTSDYRQIEVRPTEEGYHQIEYDAAHVKFRLDPEEVGESEGWHTPEFDDSDWGEMALARSLESQGVYEKGAGWYRFSFEVPEEWAGRPFDLRVGAVNYDLYVWLNGRHVGEASTIWNQPVRFDLTEAIRPGRNVMALKYWDPRGGGGIWKPALILTPQTEAEQG